ncbi:helix-turn-helix domain-containing protein [Micromonospora sp. NPDC049523]|uniref:winged helix-turn-helix transcriptional regulator n=1 Tax=Micromonospora sp. NPDC049523 TaxID=3155921 RepID=UPI003414CC5B
MAGAGGGGEEGTSMFPGRAGPDGGSAVILPLPVTAEDRAACAVTDVLRRVGEKWSVLVLALLAQRAYGFNELDRAIHGLSRRMLTRTLRLLERDGLVRRTAAAQPWQGSEYSLTDLGRSLLPLVVALGEWAVDHDTDIRRAHASFDASIGTEAV